MDKGLLVVLVPQRRNYKASLKTNLTQGLRFPEECADIIVDLLEKHKTTIANNFIFRNTQDTYFKLQNIERNQLRIIDLLTDLIVS